MDGNKLDIAAKEKEPLTPPSESYKQIPDADMASGEKSPRPKSLHKEDKSVESDGADERMLSNEDTKVGKNSNISLTEIKFTSNNEKNGDAKLDIGELKNEFVGLTKEELMKCANDPYWVRLRWFLFVSFWLLWAGMLIGAIMIIVAAPKCTPPAPKREWEEGPLKAVLSYDTEHADSIIARNEVLLVPNPNPDIYQPLNSTPEFESFLTNHKGNTLIVELTPAISNHWFAESEDKSIPFEDYYIWRGKEGSETLPNNWLARNSTSDHTIPAWQYSPKRKQYYLAPDGKPMLNFRTIQVREEFKKVLTNLLDAGIDGFALNGVPQLLVDSTFQDEELRRSASDSMLGDYDHFTHFKTENLKDLNPIVQEWRTLIKNKTNDMGVLMLTDELTTLEPFKLNDTLLIDLPRARDIFSQGEVTAPRLLKELESTYNLMRDHWAVRKVGQNSAFADGTLETVAYLLNGTIIVDSGFVPSKELREARKSPSVLFGIQKLYTVANDTVFAYIRTYPGNPGFLVAFNPTDQRVEVNFPKDIPEIPGEVTVQYFSSAYNETDVAKGLKKSAENFPISPKSAIILSYVPKSQD